MIKILQFCAHCGKHITIFMFNKMYISNIRKRPYWFCTLRCYTEWHRRFYTKRRMYNVQIEGNPFDNRTQDTPVLPE